VIRRRRKVKEVGNQEGHLAAKPNTERSRSGQGLNSGEQIPGTAQGKKKGTTLVLGGGGDLPADAITQENTERP